MGSGFVFGPALGGLAGSIDPRLPFWIAAGLGLANALYGLLILPESLAVERRAPFAWRRANPIGALQLVRRSRSLTGLAMVNFLSHLAHCVLSAVSVLYMGYRYAWDERAVGFTLAAVGVGHMIVQGTLIAPTVRHFGERGSLFIGLVVGAAGFVLMGLASSGFMFLLSIPLMSLWGLSGAALQGLMTRRVGPSEQGQLQGANMSAMGIANMIGPIIFAEVFAVSIGVAAGFDLPGLAFVLSGAMLATGAVIGWRATRGTD
jgi:DHA1 family tetracycline resistance protein-like MFS transporter